MNFKTMLGHLQAGRFATRKGWMGSSWLEYQDTGNRASEPAIFLASKSWCSLKTKRRKYTATNSELLATDWEILEHAPSSTD